MKYIVKAIPRDSHKGFYRSDRYWTENGVEVDESEITDEMREEPYLTISPVIEKKSKVKEQA